MKKLHRYVFAMPVFAVVVFYSCSDSSDKRILTNLYKKREYLLREFKDKSIINRGNKFFQLSYYKGKSVNTFFFEKEGDTLVLINDSLQYPVNEINAFVAVNHADSSYYTAILVNELSRLLKVIAKDFVYLTPYQYAGNDPIKNIDLDGLEPKTAVES